MNILIGTTGLLITIVIVLIRVILNSMDEITSLREENKKLKYELEAANASKGDIVFDAEGGYHIIKGAKDERPETMSVERNS
jgi:hypothetical protein